jgi:hypothetical protein
MLFLRPAFLLLSLAAACASAPEVLRVANHLVGTPFGSVEDRECVEVAGTTEEALADEALEVRARELIEGARHTSIILGACTLGPVGPRVPCGAGTASAKRE